MMCPLACPAHSALRSMLQVPYVALPWPCPGPALAQFSGSVCPDLTSELQTALPAPDPNH